MKVPGNYDDLVEKCRKQDELLKRRMHCGQSWYDIITDNLGGGHYRTRGTPIERLGDEDD